MKKLVPFFILLTLILSSCAPQIYESRSESGSAAFAESSEYQSDAVAEEAVVPEEIAADDSFVKDSVDADRKMTYSASITIETKEYDSDYNRIVSLAEELGGYIELEQSNSLSEKDDRIIPRDSFFNFRIPSDNLDRFIDAVSQIGELAEKERSAVDITDQYTDTDSRIAVLEERKKRLMEHLQTATDMEDIIILEDELSATISDIESLTGDKRRMDNQVDYASVNLTLEEVITPETIGKNGQPLGDRAAYAFSSSMSGVEVFLQNFAIFWAAAAPILIIAAVFLVIAFVIVKIVLYVRKRPAAKRSDDNNKTGR